MCWFTNNSWISSQKWKSVRIFDNLKIFRAIIFFSAYFFLILLNNCVFINNIFVARQWEVLMKKWCQVNKTLKALFIIDLHFKQTNRKIMFWFVGFMMLTVANHLLFLSQGLFLLSVCAEVHPNGSFGEFFFHQVFPDIFKVLPFHFSLGIFVLVIDFLLIIAWTFNDVFIIVVGLLIAKEFESFNRRISINVEVRKIKMIKYFYYKMIFNRTNQGNFGWNILKPTKHYATTLPARIRFSVLL